MSSRIVYECDRCGSSERLRDGVNTTMRLSYGWFEVEADVAGRSGRDPVSSYSGKTPKGHLCPTCADQLVKWWHRVGHDGPAQ